MKVSEFLKKLEAAALNVVRQSNNLHIDRKVFDWERVAWRTAVAEGIAPPMEDQDSVPATVIAVYHLALRRSTSRELDIQTLILLVEAWECYQKYQESENARIDGPGD